MNFGIDIHHIFARDVLDRFKPFLDDVFGGPANNPFNVDANFNKLALVNNRALAPVLQQLAASGRDILPEGFGLDAHNGGHGPLNAFQRSALTQILQTSNGLSPEAKQLAVFDLFRYLKNANEAGHPPIHSTTLTDWQADWAQKRVPLNEIATSSSLSDVFSDFMRNWDPEDLSDAGSQKNVEAQRAAAVALYEKVLRDDAIHSDVLAIYEDRLSSLTSDTSKVKPGEVGRWIKDSVEQLAYRQGIIDQSGNILPDAVTRGFQAPVAPSASDIAFAREELSLIDAKTKFAAPLDGDAPVSAYRIDTNAVADMVQPLADHLSRVSNTLSPDGRSFVDAGDLRSTVLDFGGAVNHSLDRMASATTGAEFRAFADDLVNRFDNLNRTVAEAMDKIPGGKALAFLGTLGDVVELGIASVRAYDQYMAGDVAGAMTTMQNASYGILLSTAASYAAGMAAAAFAAPAGVIVVAALVAGVLAGLAWDKFVEGWSVEPWQDAYDQFQFAARFTTPLVLDLNGNGIELTSVNGATAFFDVGVDGFAEATGWVAPSDGLLVLDVNGNGRIDNGAELFGDQTGHAHGFLALAQHDDNGDGVIDAADAVFGQLRIWQDLNQDGISQAHELRSLAEVGISSISVQSTTTSYWVARRKAKGQVTAKRSSCSAETVRLLERAQAAGNNHLGLAA